VGAVHMRIDGKKDAQDHDFEYITLVTHCQIASE
jgi:hypothetical protein